MSYLENHPVKQKQRHQEENAEYKAKPPSAANKLENLAAVHAEFCSPAE
jgi:hypothetical protein